MPRAKGGSIKPPQVHVNPGDGGLISELNENDVLSGRGGRINNHPGNITFRTVVEDYKREYLDPRTRKLEKAHVAARLVAQIRSANPPGRFLKEDSDNKGKYVEIGDQKAWKKAGQALREDAPDVRKVLDEEIKEVGPMNHNPYSSPPQQQRQQHHHVQYRPPPPVSIPSGIPPSVTYSPTHQHQLPPPEQQHRRPDPPESEGVTGYRQPPLNYYGTDGPPGRAGGGGGGPQPHHPSPHQQYSQGGPGMHTAVPPNGYHQPPPPSHHHHQGQPSPPSSYYGHPSPPQYQHHQPPQNQQHFHQPVPQPQFRQASNQYNAAQSSPPHSQHHQQQHHDPKRKKSAFTEKIPDPTKVVHSAMDTVSRMAHKMIPVERLPSKDSLPHFKSTATDFTMSDVSSFTASNLTKSSSTNPDEIFQGAVKREPNYTRTDSDNSREASFNMSDLSLGLSLGRTRSFPDLMLSTGDINLLPALPDESGGDSDDVLPQRTSSGRILRPMPLTHARQSSSGSGSNESMASLTLKGFHPVRGRTNTQNTTGAISGLNDAMSIMSIDSHKMSMKSDNSSWMENLKSMQSIHSDSRNAHLLHDDTGSVRSLLSDISNDLNALDLAEPLLPPYPVDQSYDSEYLVRRPDP